MCCCIPVSQPRKLLFIYNMQNKQWKQHAHHHRKDDWRQDPKTNRRTNVSKLFHKQARHLIKGIPRGNTDWSLVQLWCSVEGSDLARWDWAQSEWSEQFFVCLFIYLKVTKHTNDHLHVTKQKWGEGRPGTYTYLPIHTNTCSYCGCMYIRDVRPGIL